MMADVSQERQEWARELSEARVGAGGGAEAYQRFEELLHADQRGNDLFGANALIATLTSTPEDNGEGEAVLSVLASFEPSIRARAVVEAIPRLHADKAGDWLESILATEGANFSESLVAAAEQSGDVEAKGILSEYLRTLSSDARLTGERDFWGPIADRLDSSA